MDTGIGTFFPIHVFVFVSLKVCWWTQIGSKSNIATTLKSFSSLVHLRAKESSLSKRVSRSCYTLIYFPRIDFSHSFTACRQMMFQFRCSVEKRVTIRASQGSEDCVNVAHVTYMFFVSQQSNRNLVFQHTPSSEFTYTVHLYNIDIIEKDIQ